MKQPESSVVLVEDDVALAEVITGLLQADGIHVRHAGDAAGAYALLDEALPDLVLLDLGLPGGTNGFAVLSRLREQPATRHVPVIVITAWNRAEDKLRGFELGAVDYLVKPFDAAELRARVRAVLRTKHLQGELARINEELNQSRAHAEQVARARADFLATMSHEIRTPMNGVIAMAGLLLETPLNHEQRGYVETIYSCSEALLAIINDVLDFSKIESGGLELESAPFALRACVEAALDVLAAKAAEKNLELAYQCDDGVPERVVGDENRLRQVLCNLISNAVKFTTAGEVVVQVQVHSRPPADAPAPAPWQIQFSVRDTGIGIPPERMARLFKPFSQADIAHARQYGGTGLGLVISKRLVELMGGKMWVESVPEKGSTFSFVLPLPVEMEASESAAVRAAAPPLADLRLLIVDDNPTNCRILTLQTAKWGMIARGTLSAEQALQWLRAGENFDLAILDMQMPGMDGLTLAREIRQLPQTRQLPLVLLTSMGVHCDRPEVAELHLAGCLTKPIKPVALYEVLFNAVSGSMKRPTSPAAPARLDPGLAERHPLRVMVCDDNLVNQKVCVRLLQQLGYRPDVTENGRELLAAMDRQPYDMIFLDVLMPEMDGYEATRQIRERQKNPATHPSYRQPIVIVAVTASAMQGDREKCLAAGMDDYLPKPIRPEDVRRIIERWAPVTRPAGVGAGMQESSGLSPQADAAAGEATDNPSVDLERLRDFTDGTAAGFRELVELYLQQTARQLEQLRAAVQMGDAEQVRRVAHSCAGASATCGMRRLAPLLRQLEHRGMEGNLESAPVLLEQIEREFAVVQGVLTEALQRVRPASAGAATAA